MTFKLKVEKNHFNALFLEGCPAEGKRKVSDICQGFLQIVSDTCETMGPNTAEELMACIAILQAALRDLRDAVGAIPAQTKLEDLK